MNSTLTAQITNPQITVASATLGQAALKLDCWLNTMRGPAGYGGPVVHWWQDCLRYAGPALDWRYEGIIIGYLHLFGKTGNSHWLNKAKRAADDLVCGQLETGNYRASSFELNPYCGGTPHEAAGDVALLSLAECLATRGDDGWAAYFAAAERNLAHYILGRLWDPNKNMLHNTFADASFVPNKAATTVEALLLWAKLSGQRAILTEYVTPILDAIVAAQVYAPGKRHHGAMEQAVNAGQGTGHYFPYYVARCIPALLLGYQHTHELRYKQAAENAMSFILRERLPDGSFPQVIYGNERENRFPQWVAGVGDVLRAMSMMKQSGMELTLAPTLTWLLNGQLPSGAIRTASGFAARSSGKVWSGPPDFRDLLPVCGWIDKAFRFLASAISELPPTDGAQIAPFQTACTAWGKRATYRESAAEIVVTQHGQIVYQWRKGEDWAHWD